MGNPSRMGQQRFRLTWPGSFNLLRLSLCAAAALGFCWPVLAADDELVVKGRAILQERCARCHAIGLTGESPHPQAPPFRAVVKRYPVEDLAESLAEGIVSGHPDMPVFTFEPAEINTILAYLGSLSRQDGDKPQ